MMLPTNISWRQTTDSDSIPGTIPTGPLNKRGCSGQKGDGGGLAVTCDCVFLTAGGMAETAVQEAC